MLRKSLLRPFRQRKARRSTTSNAGTFDFAVNEKYDLTTKAGNTHLKNYKQYEEMYKMSIKNPEAYWDHAAKQNLTWFSPYTQILSGSFKDGNIAWFLNGSLNVAYNCIDRHLPAKSNQIAIIFEGDDPADIRKLTYNELHQEVCKLSNSLKSLGVRKGDRVAIYMPMVPEAVVAMLACARIGAVHTVVFAGFSPNSLKTRIMNCNAKVLITANEGLRGGKNVPLKKMADEAIKDCPSLEKVLVYKRTHNDVPFTVGRDIWWHEIMRTQKPYCPPERMDSEDPLFLLYTSGSTGTPKGIEHTSAGYLLYTAVTHKYIFDYKPGDVYACVADIGWITGHSYIVYGPLANGATTLMFEGLPTHPNPSRYWNLIDRHKVNQFYTAPTAIRTLMKFGDEPLKGFDLSSLRILGTVGEPINPKAWKWYFSEVGKQNCTVVDTYWQTETGGIILSAIPGVNVLKPGSATIPFFGIEPVLMDSMTGKEAQGTNVSGFLSMKKPWPGIGRTVFGDHARYISSYLNDFPGYYFTGDGTFRDQDNFYWITGRVDDVINKAGHRLGSAEIEGALVSHKSIAEAAVIAVQEEVKGEAIWAFCTLQEGITESPDLLKELRENVAKVIGKIAIPDEIVLTESLPKTRSGKIMRRLLKKVASGQTSDLGDVSTLADPELVPKLVQKVKTDHSTSK